MIVEAQNLIHKGSDLSEKQMTSVMEEILTGKAATPQIVSFLLALNNKGESVEEVSAAVKVMRKYAILVNTKQKVILDTCGTGGDAKGTFNISTTVAFVVAASGVVVAKHGNRSVSSASGSADWQRIRQDCPSRHLVWYGWIGCRRDCRLFVGLLVLVAPPLGWGARNHCPGGVGRIAGGLLR